MQRIIRAKGNHPTLAIGHRVHIIALKPIERQFLAVGGKEITAKEHTHFFQNIAHMAQHRIIAMNGIFGLQTVAQINQN